MHGKRGIGDEGGEALAESLMSSPHEDLSFGRCLKQLFPGQ